MGSYVKVLRYVVWLTQLGLSVAVPLAGFILLAVWLHGSKGWGAWVIPVGILLGLMGAVGGLYNGFRMLNRQIRQDEDRHAEGYNRHE